jgi:LPS O-antigen subunit length determinant protein (WzzB/FepE family)
MLERFEDGTFALTETKGDSNTSFSYHLYLKQTIEQAIAEKQVQKYHFMLLRNLYEKTASFLGYQHWDNLLPDDKQAYLKRIMHFTSHSTLSNEAVAEPTEQEKQTVKFLLDHLKDKYRFFPKDKKQ